MGKHESNSFGNFGSLDEAGAGDLEVDGVGVGVGVGDGVGAGELVGDGVGVGVGVTAETFLDLQELI